MSTEGALADSRPPLLIVGASTRAAAHSAVRAGFRPVCVDLFGDVDLRAHADVTLSTDYPGDLPALVDALPAMPWMYTGALENHPDIIARIAADRDLKQQRPGRSAAAGTLEAGLLGNGTEILAEVRDPWWLAATLRAAGLPALDVWPAESGEELSTARRDGTWLQKPLAGAGGRRICAWDREAPPLDEPHYFQRRVSGPAYSAQFLGLPGRAVLLGVTRQLIGLTAVHATPYAWCGAVAGQVLARPGAGDSAGATLGGISHSPLPLDGGGVGGGGVSAGRSTLAPPSPTSPPRGGKGGEDPRDAMRKIGETLAAAAGLRGLFGCDFILEGSTPWLLEVNPRYTAAMELLDHLLETSLVGWHLRACQTFVSDRGDARAAIEEIEARTQLFDASRPCVGKIVLFARQDAIMGDARGLLFDRLDARLPFAADISAPGTVIRAGQPICTLFASDSTEEACIARLLDWAARFQRRFLR